MVVGFCINQNIAKQFREIYSDLYSSVPDRDLNDVISRLSHLVEESHHPGHSPSSPRHSVSDAMVRSAVQSRSTNKRDKPGVSVVTILGMAGGSLFLLPSRVINAMILHGSSDILFN